MADRRPRDRKVLKQFVEMLRKWPPFRRLPECDQLELAHMVWTDKVRVRAHDVVTNATSYTWQDLERRFGRSGFKRVNEIAKAFEVGPWSKDRGSTKSYRLAPAYKKARQLCVKRAVKRMKEGDGFIDMNGKPVKTLPKAIASKRDDGSTARLWGDVELVSAVPINMHLLEQEYEQTCREIKQCRAGKRSHDLFAIAGDLDLDRLENRAEWVAALLLLANTGLGGHGWIPMRYREAESGRLYALDDNLQNCPAEVRRAALAGCWDVDISNCHFTLLAQLAAHHGIACPAIREYLSNKTEFRLDLAERIGADVEQIKTCLLAPIYGAPLSSSPRTAIGKELGAMRAKKLLAIPAFRELAAEVKQAGKQLMEKWPVKSGSLMNAAGYGIRRTEKPRQKLAHLMQGAEALILKTAVQYVEQQRPHTVILLQHDGFSTTVQIDCAALQAHVEAETGFQIVFEQEQIQPSPGRDFSKLMKPLKAA